MTKLAPEWVRTSDPVIRIPARYRWSTAPVHIYGVRECISDNVCSLIKLHPFSAMVFLVAIVCPDFFKLIGLLLRKGKVDAVSDHLCEHYIVLKDKCGQY